jgi:GTP pyrophosphokinase
MSTSPPRDAVPAPSSTAPTTAAGAAPSEPGKAPPGGDAARRDPLRVALDHAIADLLTHHPHADVAAVEAAYAIAHAAHAGQLRKSGDPYLVHPVRVAGIIARLGLDGDSVVAGILHDTIEDSGITVFDLTERFGRSVANLVDGVTKLGKVPYLSRREQQAESFRKMLLAMSQDIRVLLVKLADRLDNMRTLEHMPADKRERIARETAEIYVPLAGRLGVQWLHSELANLSFRWLDTAQWEETEATMTELFARQPAYMESCIEHLRAAFSPDEEFSGETTIGATKDRIWSRELHGEVELRATRRPAHEAAQLAKDRGELRDVADLVSFQVVVGTRAACYVALGQLHAVFKPLPGNVRDYIALPRPNHYQALHTSVVDSTGRRIDLQIRTEEMDAVAERGIVVDIVRGQAGLTAHEQRKLAWLRQLMDWQDDVQDPNEFIENVKADLFADEVYVFTPGGDIVVLPKGATAIDFAFAIHSDLGLRCAGTRVNGIHVPLRYRLRQGDTVEIMTNPQVEPREEWLSICTTPRARARVKQFLRQRARTRHVSAGKGLLSQYLAKRGFDLDELEAEDMIIAHLEALGIARDRGVEGLYEDVALGRLVIEDVALRLAPDIAAVEIERKAPTTASLLTRVLRRMSGGRSGQSSVDNKSLGAALARSDAHSPLMLTPDRIAEGAGVIRLAPCCRPLPGDPLVGYVDPDRGIVAHVEGCLRALDELAERRVYLAWPDGMEVDRPVVVEVRTGNTVGLLAEMSRVFSAHGVDIKEANCRASDDQKRAVNTFHATVRSLDRLDALFVDIKKIKGVFAVERVFDGG